MFALFLLPMIGMMGIGIDVGRSFEAKTSFDAANDAAALSAATQAQTVLQNGGSIGAAQSAGQSSGAIMFAADAARAGATIGQTPTPTINVTINALTKLITAQSTYSANVPTLFGKMFGTPSMAIGNTAKANLGTPKFINISVAIDISQSMGLAATTTGIAQLRALTPDQCAFGCHVPQPGQPLSYEQVAHNAGIQLRIDVIKSATQNMITTAQTTPGSAGVISFALYALQVGPPNASQVFTTISPPSMAYPTLLGLAAGIDLGNNSSTFGFGDSDFQDSLVSLTNTVATSGNGYTPSTPQQFVFLMTDGVEDIFGNGPGCSGMHCTGPIDPNWCNALKAKGVTVGVIYTTYLAMPTDGRYISMVQPFANQIAPSLQACASNGWFYQATDATDIQNAINALFAQAKSFTGVLTQ